MTKRVTDIDLDVLSQSLLWHSSWTVGSQFVFRESFCIYLLPHTCTRRYINFYHEGTFLMQVTFREVRDGGWTGREGVFSKFLPSIFTSMFLQNKTALHQNAYFEII